MHHTHRCIAPGVITSYSIHYTKLYETASLRFFALEHWLMMIIAAALVHMASAKVKKTTDSQKKFRLTAIWFGIALIIVLVSIPWPGTVANRPLLRLFGLAF